MIFDTYLAFQKIKERKSLSKRQDDENAQRGAYNLYDTQAKGDIPYGQIILGLIIMVVLSIFIAYVFYSCIKSNCMSFIVFLLFIIFLNIPVLNIFAFVILIIYWLVYCRKGCKRT
jgi:uncharacterized Tic20 family protein